MVNRPSLQCERGFKPDRPSAGAIAGAIHAQFQKSNTADVEAVALLHVAFAANWRRRPKNLAVAPDLKDRLCRQGVAAPVVKTDLET